MLRPTLLVILLMAIFVSGAKNKKAPPKQRRVDEAKIEQYRKNFIFNLLNNIPFKFPTFKLQNDAKDEDEEKSEGTELDDDTVIFYLYNRKQPYNSIIINNDLHLVDPNIPTKILVHGWTEHYYVAWCKNLTDAYLSRGNYNIIVLDWSKKGDADYFSASMSVKEVSDIIGDFIVKRLYREKKIKLSSLHLISHSLGCHVAGLTGQRVLKVSGQKLGRITALDPAAPVFEIFTIANSDRLSPDDANFVDIVHTDSGVLGFRKSIGIVDFHPNGGKAVQPGCSLLRPDVTYDDLFCSHARSHKIYLRSVLNPDLRAVPCDTWEHFESGKCDNNSAVAFGEDSPNSISGNYFLRTPENPI